jgi:ferredoxin
MSDSFAGSHRDEPVTLTVWRDEEQFQITVARGSNLRRTLLAHNLTPYAWVTRQLNCRGRGLCATCGVRIDDEPAPTHWHDKAAAWFGYPRLSCQITVTEPLTVRLATEKIIWGGRRKRSRGPHQTE